MAKYLIQDRAFQLEREIKKLRRHMNTAFWEMIKRLEVAKRLKIWKQLDYDSWASWLAQEGIDLKKSTVNRYIRGYKAVRKSLGNPEHEEVFNLPRSKVLMIAGKINEQNASELVSKAQVLSYSDLAKEMSPEQNDDPPRPPKPRFEWCDVHNKWRLTYGSFEDICIHHDKSFSPPQQVS